MKPLHVNLRDKFNLTKNIKYAFHRVENIVERGENAGYQSWFVWQRIIDPVEKAFENVMEKDLAG